MKMMGLCITNQKHGKVSGILVESQSQMRVLREYYMEIYIGAFQDDLSPLSSRIPDRDMCTPCSLAFMAVRTVVLMHRWTSQSFLAELAKNLKLAINCCCDCS